MGALGNIFGRQIFTGGEQQRQALLMNGMLNTQEFSMVDHAGDSICYNLPKYFETEPLGYGIGNLCHNKDSLKIKEELTLCSELIWK